MASLRGPLVIDNHNAVGVLYPTMVQARAIVLESMVIGADWLGPERNADVFAARPTQETIDLTGDLAYQAATAGRVIDFGDLPNDVIMEGGRRGGPLYSKGLLTLPFRDPWVLYHTWEDDTGIYLVSLLDHDWPAATSKSWSWPRCLSAACPC